MSTRATEADRGRRRRLVLQWRRSGLAAAEFAEAVGVGVRTLARWRREAEAPPTHAAHTSRATPISLRLGDGFELRLPSGFDTDSLRRAVEVLQPLAGAGPRQIRDAVRPAPLR
jgi:hypothetical protein